MGRDEFVIVVLAATPVILAGMTAGLLFTFRRMMSTRCPSCRRRVAKTALTDDGLSCADCNEVPTSAADQRTHEPTCHHCHVVFGLAHPIRLWDGHDY